MCVCVCVCVGGVHLRCWCDLMFLGFLGGFFGSCPTSSGPNWPRGGSRVNFNFWLGETSCGPFSLYYMSSHHDVLRKEMGCADMGQNCQGEE